jgi:hypothetical protein
MSDISSKSDNINNDIQTKKYICNICCEKFHTKWNLDRHSNRKNKCIPYNGDGFKCQNCNKVFPKKYNLERHLTKQISCRIQNNEIKSDNDSKNIDALNEIIKQQNEMFSKLIMTMSNNNNNQVSSNTNSNNTNTNSNNTNSHNNTMNTANNACLINYVVQQYPNAKNIEDCIKLENIPKMMLTECEDLYFTDGAMKIFKGLCDIGEEHRPIHCTDASRCNYIYKSNDVWKIDVGGEAIRNHFFPVIQEAYTQVHKKRIKDNPGNSTIIGNYLIEMTGSNVKKICQKTLKRLSNDFLAKNSKNSKLIKMQK